MTDADSIAAGFAQVGEWWGLINSPGAHHRTRRRVLEDMTDADWDAAFSLGTMAGVRSIRAALPLLRAADWARIVTLRHI